MVRKPEEHEVRITITKHTQFHYTKKFPLAQHSFPTKRWWNEQRRRETVTWSTKSTRHKGRGWVFGVVLKLRCLAGPITVLNWFTEATLIWNTNMSQKKNAEICCIYYLCVCVCAELNTTPLLNTGLINLRSLCILVFDWAHFYLFVDNFGKIHSKTATINQF